MCLADAAVVGDGAGHLGICNVGDEDVRHGAEDSDVFDEVVGGAGILITEAGPDTDEGDGNVHDPALNAELLEGGASMSSETMTMSRSFLAPRAFCPDWFLD